MTYAELRSWHDELVAGSDRSAILVASAYLDHVLRSYISTHFVARLSDTEANAMFADLGAPLGTFNGKILIAYALGAYDAETREELHAIRRIRNACAHSPRPVSFSDPLVLAEAALLKEPSIRLTETGRRQPEVRRLFSARCVEIAYRITEAAHQRQSEDTELLRYIGPIDD